MKKGDDVPKNSFCAKNQFIKPEKDRSHTINRHPELAIIRLLTVSVIINSVGMKEWLLTETIWGKLRQMILKSRKKR